MSMSSAEQPGLLQSFSIDQAAGASALLLGSFGGLLMVIWKSRCLCRCRLGCSDRCYVFDCVREPPPPEEIAGDSDEEKGEAAPAPKKPAPESLLPEPEPEPEPPAQAKNRP
eukprot:COSAG04_NODE_5704_length_1519_cov_2.068310_3_plen_112_part_00